MKFLGIFLSLALFSTQADATVYNFFRERGIPSCKIYAFYLEFPTGLTPEIQLQLSMVDAVAESTGWPRGNFKVDFVATCRDQPNLTVDEVIRVLFDKYKQK
jgi:hypothetical protein